MWPKCPRRFGVLLQQKSTSFLVGVGLLLLALCVAIKSARLDAELDSWLQRTSRVESELSTIRGAVGEDAGAGSLLLLQAPRRDKASVLTVDALMVHLEALGVAYDVTVDLYGVPWSLVDICFKPSLPDLGGLTGLLSERLVPCAIKTPLDCFWEGAKLLGRAEGDQPITFGSLGPKHKWTSMNPLLMLEALQRNYPHASFSYETLIDWMRRVGLTSGYQQKPCLDPSEPNCPMSAPNKFSREPPNVAAVLTGGCHGVAAKLMHWPEEELVGGATRNKSGHLVRAGALQSSIQLMGEHNLYEWWRSDSTKRVDNWSVDKAKHILDTWQSKYKEQLSQVMDTYGPSKPFKVHALTTNSMLEPINEKSLLDLTNLQLCFVAMTLFSCITFPAMSFGEEEGSQIQISRFKIVILAIVSSTIVALTFVASLGLSSYMNYAYNLATTQILPPLALYYGFRQLSAIASIYSQKLKQVPIKDLTAECLDEMLPIIIIDCVSNIIPLYIASLVPVRATQAFAVQAITFYLLSSVVTIIGMPALFASFISHHIQDATNDESQPSPPNYYSVCKPHPRSRVHPDQDTNKRPVSRESRIEDDIFSRIHDDLKNIRADSHHQGLNISARLDINGFQTNLSLTSSQRTRGVSSSAATCGSIDPSQSQPSCSTAISPPKYMGDELYSSHSNEAAGDIAIDDNVSLESNSDGGKNLDSRWFRLYSNSLTSNKPIQLTIVFLRLCISVAILTYSSEVKYGLQLRDILVRGTSEHESFLMQERYFPTYNVFAITKGNFDYPSNQRLLHEYYERFQQVEGVIKTNSENTKFWLAQFRDWLLELQNRFDTYKNVSTITAENWSEASDSVRLAYKLLAQTGRTDSPIDKSLIDTNRLVDSHGIINSKAFYHYLGAWVMTDAFTYSITEANFRPEPKSWNERSDDLRVEKARPLSYTQIPFLMKLPSSHDNLRTILELRSLSQAFEQLGLPNFPTGIPFIYWDQFINLDLVLFAAVSMSIALVYIIIAWISSNFLTAAIFALTTSLTTLELYGLMGLLSISFNNILAVLVINTIGMSIIQTVYVAIYYDQLEGDTYSRISHSLERRMRIIVSGLMQLAICGTVFTFAPVDFMTKYSYLLLCSTLLNLIGALFFVPVLICLIGQKSGERLSHVGSCARKSDAPKIFRLKNTKTHKKRKYPRVQSEISLSTISEEPQSEAQVADLKLDLSIRCY